jgi:hypothetical protein
MKKMFIFVAIAGLAFASCKKDDLVESTKVNNPARTDKSTWISSSKEIIIEDGEKFMEYTNSISKQKVYLSLGETTKAASRYSRQQTQEWVEDGSPEGGFYRITCSGVGTDCYNTVDNNGVIIVHTKDISTK